MLFEKKIDRAQKWLRGKNKDAEELPTPEELKKESQEIKLEKGELPLMIFLALVIILPVCLLVLLAICSFVFFL
ncbi:MAG: hypothetical protein ACI4PL_02700 [Faecousia sp.]